MVVSVRGAQPSGASKQVQAGSLRFGSGLVLACSVVWLTGCSKPPSLNPVDWWHTMQGGRIAEDRPDPPGAEDPYPNLSTVPARPTPPDRDAMKKLTEALVGDRTNAHYSAEAAPLADPSSPTASPNLFGSGTLPPPPPASPAAVSASLPAASAPPAPPEPAAPPAPPEPTAPPAPVAPPAARPEAVTPPSRAPVTAVQSAPLDVPAPAAAQPSAPAAPPAATPVAPPAAPSSAPPATPSPGPLGGSQAASPPAAPETGAPPPARAAPVPGAELAPPPIAPGPLPGLPTEPPARAAAAPAPPPPPPPAISPIPPPASASATVIPFAAASSTVSPTAGEVIKAFAAKRGGGSIVVTGYGDAITSDPGAQTAALSLALSRAQAVANALTAAGVPQSAIQVGAEAAGRGVGMRMLQ